MFVFSNLATSIDGKIATVDRGQFPLGTPRDRKQMQALRKRADAVLMGASTLRAFKRPLLIFGRKKQLLNVIVTRSLEGVSPEWPFFHEPKIERLIFFTGKMSPARRRAFEKVAELVVLKASAGGAAAQIVQELTRRGIKKLLVEGGGGVMWDFFHQDLIDEVHLTLTPRVLGGDTAPTLVDGSGFLPEEVLNLRLKRCRRIGNELFLIYERDRKIKRGRGLSV